MRVAPFLLCFFVLVSTVSLGQPIGIDIRLPSDAADGGTLAVRLSIPRPEVGPRYGTVAPILVFVPGAQGVGGLNNGASYADEGFVSISFIFPGGIAGGQHSDGTYDYRGPRCIEALRDVLLFAGGRTTDVLGRSIDAILPFPALTDRFGMIGSSNGGPISMATLATYGGELDFVATYVGWENPTNSQSVLVELGGKWYDCDMTDDGDGNGIPTDDGKNPYLGAYGPTSIDVDFDRLAYDPNYSWTVTDPANQFPPVVHTGALFLDGNGNGVIDTDPYNPECYDADGNGVLEEGEDYPFRPTPSFEGGTLLLHYSIEVAREAALRDSYAGNWPTDVADSTTTNLFWSYRDATGHYDALVSTLPDLKCLLVFNAADHVQAPEEHLHIQQAYDGLSGHGLWCRLNPDASYYRLVDPSPPLEPVDNDANIPVAWPDMGGYHEPYGLSSPKAQVAAVLEMADRAWAGDWSVNLERPVVGVDAIPSVTTLRLTIDPNPATLRSVIAWRLPTPAPAELALYDVGGRRRAQLRLNESTSTHSISLSELSGAAGHLPVGIYWLEVRTASQRTTTRFLLLDR